MGETQLSALADLLAKIVDPPFEDEQIGDDEKQGVARSKAWFKGKSGTSLETLAAELGIEMSDIRSVASGLRD